MATLKENIRRRTGSEYLIGCYTEKEGRKYFEDIRGIDGEPITAQGIDGKTLEIPIEDSSLDKNTFYSFKWDVLNEKEGKLKIVGKPKAIDRPAFLNRLFNVYANKTGKDLSDSINFQNTIFSEVTGAEHTYIYELLQNANDYPYEGEEDNVRVKFILTQHYLLFLHTGAEFNLRNIVGICSINQGEKKGNKNTIGYKGIGFKTVFVNNDVVYLKSGEWNLRFDKKYAEEECGGECAWSLMPIPSDMTEAVDELREALKNIPSDYRVQFALHHKEDARKNIKQLTKVFGDEQILLFIPHVAEAEVLIDGIRKFDVKKDKEKWIVDQFHYPVPSDLREWVSKSIERGGSKIPDKFKEIDTIGISFAVSRHGKEIKPLEDARVYNYLPTELDLGFHFLINADFIPNGSRSGLHDVEWNNRVMEECGRKFVDWWTGLLKNEGEWDMNSVFSLLPDFSSRNPYAANFMDGFIERMHQIPCIPVLVNGEYKLCMLSEIINDGIGLVSGENRIFSDEEFYSFTRTNKYLAHPAIRSNSFLLDLLEETFSSECSVYSADDLKRLPSNINFEEWLLEVNNNIKFNSYLISARYMDRLIGSKIFLTEEGKLEAAGELYLNVDKYLEDISFLSDYIPRLNVTVREALNKLEGWGIMDGKFMNFSNFVFAKQMTQLAAFDGIRDRLKSLENNVKFIHFLAKSDGANNLNSIRYPLFTDEGKVVEKYSDLFIPNELGQNFKSQSWIEENWVHFIHPDYFLHNKDRVRRFLDENGIHLLTTERIFDDYISKDANVAIISERIKDKTNNVNFYRYVAQTFDGNRYKLTSYMRKNLCLIASNGKNDLLVPISTQVYNYNEELENVRMEPWLPADMCLSLSNIYNKGLTETEKSDFHQSLGAKSVVFVFTYGQLGNIIKSNQNLQNICQNIKTEEASKCFLNFLFEYKKEIFRGDIHIPEGFKDIPIKWEGVEAMASCNDIVGMKYYHTPELDELQNQTWFAQASISVCSHCYDDLFDGKERRDFYMSLGLYSFDVVSYLRSNVISDPLHFGEAISEKASNLSFHRFLYSIKNQLTENDFEKLQQLPIYISSPDNPEGVLTENSNNHYLPSALLQKVINLDVFPADILDAIHPDYIRDDNERKYFIDQLGNVEMSKDQLASYIKRNVDRIAGYLSESDRNVKFWRWVVDSNFSNEELQSLSGIPLLYHSLGGNDKGQLLGENLFISNSYSDIVDIEQFVAQYEKAPCFVSSRYIEKEKDKAKWIRLFKSICVATDMHDIVFYLILPNLQNYENVNIVGLLAQQESDIRKDLNNPKSDIREDLSRLRLLCDDGKYRYPSQALLSGSFLDVNENPLPEVKLPNLVSESYISEVSVSVEGKSRIKRLLTSIMDGYSATLNLTALKKKKLEYFLAHQNDYRSVEHYSIIGQIAQMFKEDSDGIMNILRGKDIYLYQSNGVLGPAYKMYLGSKYAPDCDFEGHGVDEFNYLSNDYQQVIPEDTRRLFFKVIGIKQWFTESCLKFLKIESFARYFWSKYAVGREYDIESFCTEAKLGNILCIPTKEGVKKPYDLYDYRNDQLYKIVSALPNGAAKLPDVILPNWINKIGLRARLSFTDCLHYLLLDTHDYRRIVLKWITDTKDETIYRHRLDILTYRQNAKWFSGAKKWVPLDSLVALEWGNETLSGNFSSNAYVCNQSYMPEYKQDFDRLCKILDIKIISNKDLQKRKSGQCYNDETARKEIGKRLLYLAYKSGKNDWEDTYASQLDKLRRCDISSCERIDYYYNDDITTDLTSFIDDNDKLWYVGAWNGPMFLDVLKWCIRVFEIKGLEESYLKKLFLDDFNQFLRKNNIDFSEDFLKYLDEDSKKGLLVESAEQAEEWTEIDESTSVMFDEHDEDYGSEAMETDDRGNSQQDNSTEEGDNDDSIATSNEKEVITRQRKERSDKGKHHEGYHRKDASVNDDFDDDEDEENRREDIKDRLEKEWAQRKTREVKSPRSSSHKGSDEIPMDDNLEQSAAIGGNFFEKDSSDGYNSLPESNTQTTLKRKRTEAHNSAEKADDQLKINELLMRTPKYTFLWFKYLMEMMYADRTNMSISSIQIDFFKMEILDEENTIRLSKPSKVIPAWILDADRLQIVASKNGSGKTLKGVSVYHVDDESLDIMLSSDSNAIEVCKAATKFRLDATNSNNIVDALQDRFLQLDFADDYDMKANLPDDISFIYGPPGTGKTTRVAEEVSKILTDSADHTNILILTPTNKAADVMAEKLMEHEICYDCLSRYGATEDMIIQEQGIVSTRDTMDMNFFDKNVVVTTAARFPYDTVKPDDSSLCDYPWDYIIIDEASMMDIVTLTYILYKSKTAKFIVSGDPMQIQPVKQNDVYVENIYQMLGINELAHAKEDAGKYPLEALTLQYRSVPTIGNIVSRFAYNGRVRTNRSSTSQKALKLDGIKINTVNFIGFEVRDFSSLFGLGAVGGSALHLYSAIFTYNMVVYTAQQIAKHHSYENYTIGIVCPYKAEAEAINQMIESRPIDNENCKVSCGTVHSFQGDECDIMFVVLNPPAYNTSGTHVNNTNIINVAISRARDYLFFVVPDGQIDGYNVKNKLGKIIDANVRSILHCKDIEKVIFGEENYIESNTEITPHLTVNVYYNSQAKYDVRWDDSALDIQMH